MNAHGICATLLQMDNFNYIIIAAVEIETETEANWYIQLQEIDLASYYRPGSYLDQHFRVGGEGLDQLHLRCF